MSDSALRILTIVHVIISLAAIVAGFIVVGGWIAGRRLERSFAFFFVTTALTSATGFLFPIKGMTPGLAFGIITLAVLALVGYAQYSRRLAGRWRLVCAIGSIFTLYLNFVVLIVQSFQKIPALKALAPTQSEPPFLAVQLTSLVVFLVAGTLAIRRFPRPADPA